MSWYYYIGQKVVCINDTILEGEPGPYVVKGHIYTVDGFETWWDNSLMLILAEMPPPDNHDPKVDWSRGHNAEYFRPVTNISKLEEILQETKIPEEV